jgi:hypothetical protein
MRKNIKIILIVLILFLAGIAAVLGMRVAKTYFSGASLDVEPKNVKITAQESSATITWQSDKPSIGVVEYGTNQGSLLLRAVESSESTSHRVVLSPLKPSTNYYFRIRVGEVIYDNNGVPYSLKTKEAEVTITPSPTAKPTSSQSPSSTPSAGSSSLVSQCDSDEFSSRFGTSDPAYDFDKNGQVNTRDWLECLEVNGQ